MKKTIFFLALITGLLVACERDVDVKLPPHDKKLVVHAQQAQDRFFQIRIGHSLGITEPVNYQNNEQYNVPDAQVLLKQNGAVWDTLHYNTVSRAYEGSKPALLGYRYDVEAAAPGFDKAEGSSAFPPLVRPFRVQLKRNVRVEQDRGPQDEISVTFADDGAATNQYLFRIRRAGGSFADCVFTNDKDVERLVYSEPFYTSECLDGDRLLVSDKNFNGATKTIVFYVNTYEMEAYADQQGNTLRPVLELLHINDDYFRYMKSVNAYDNAQDNPFAEPTNIITNVKNGYGFFTTFAQAADTLQ